MCTRKVIFTLTSPQDLGFDPDMNEEERKQSVERMKERAGNFHGWHDIEEKSACTDNYLVKKVALIEDLETGKIHEIDSEHFYFVKE